MVRTYKKKSSRGSWSIESMKQAIDAVLSKTAGYRKAAKLYGVPQTTLERHVVKIRKGELSLNPTPGTIQTETVFLTEVKQESDRFDESSQADQTGFTDPHMTEHASMPNSVALHTSAHMQARAEICSARPKVTRTKPKSESVRDDDMPRRAYSLKERRVAAEERLADAVSGLAASGERILTCLQHMATSQERIVELLLRQQSPQ